MSRTLAFATSSLVLAFSLGCSMGDTAATSTTPASVEPEASSETCCCEYKEEGAAGPSYSDMAQSNCESWGYACVEDDKCAEAEAEAEGGDDKAEGSGDDKAEGEEEEAEGEEAEEAAPAPRPTSGRQIRGSTTLTRDGAKTSGGSSSGGSRGSSSGGKTMRR